MPPYNATLGEGMTRYFDNIARAREIDPEAFKGFKVTEFTEDQRMRQFKAISQAEREKAKT